MDALHRLSLYAGVCVVLLVIALCAAIVCGVGGGWDGWIVFAFQSQQSAELDAQLKAVKRSKRAKDQIVMDLIERRLTLVQAAARFRAVNRATHGKDLSEARLLHPGRTYEPPPGGYEECLCWNVINRVEAYAERTLEQTTDQVAALRARLEGELRDHLNRHGSIRLPASCQD